MRGFSLQTKTSPASGKEVRGERKCLILICMCVRVRGIGGGEDGDLHTIMMGTFYTVASTSPRVTRLCAILQFVLTLIVYVLESAALDEDVAHSLCVGAH